MSNLPSGGQQVHWSSIKNNEASSAPAFAVMEITEAATKADDGRTTLTGVQPTANGVIYHINGPTAIPAGGYGVVATTYPVWAQYESSSGTPAVNEEWGPKASQWTMDKTGTGWYIVGAQTTVGGKDIVLVQPKGGGDGSSTALRLRFTIVTADCSENPPEATVTTDDRQCDADDPGNVTVYDPSGCYFDEPDADLIGRKGWASKMHNGGSCRWEVDSLCCDEEACS